MVRLASAMQVFAAALVCTSCASQHQPFPSNWAAPARGSGDHCPEISGVYRNEGETPDGKVANRLMSRWFQNAYDLPLPIESWKHVSKVSILQTGNDLIQISGLSSSAVLFSTSLSKSAGDFHCADGWVKVKGSNLVAVSSAFMKTKETRGFSKAGAYLVEMIEAESFGMMLIVPVGGSGTYWFRYAEISPQHELVQ